MDAAPNVNPEVDAGAEDGAKENPPVDLGGATSSFFSSSPAPLAASVASLSLPVLASSPPFAMEPNVAPNEKPLLGLPPLAAAVDVDAGVVAGDVGGDTLWPNRSGLGFEGGFVKLAGASLGAGGAVMGEVFLAAAAAGADAGADEGVEGVAGVEGVGAAATGNLKLLFSA